MLDKVGKIVYKDDKIAIAGLMFDGKLQSYPCIKLATVLDVDRSSIKIKFDYGGFVDTIYNNEFVIISSNSKLDIYEDITQFAQSFGI